MWVKQADSADPTATGTTLGQGTPPDIEHSVSSIKETNFKVCDKSR